MAAREVNERGDDRYIQRDLHGREAVQVAKPADEGRRDRGRAKRKRDGPEEADLGSIRELAVRALEDRRDAKAHTGEDETSEQQPRRPALSHVAERRSFRLVQPPAARHGVETGLSRLRRRS